MDRAVDVLDAQAVWMDAVVEQDCGIQVRVDVNNSILFSRYAKYIGHTNDLNLPSGIN